MFVLEQNLWIVLIFYIDIFMPVSCQAAVETNKVWMEKEEDALYTFTLKPKRSLLDWDSDYRSSNSDSSAALIYVLIGTGVTIICILIRCCIRLAKEEYEDTSERTLHPPPRTQHYPPGTSAPPRGRPLVPPRTSSSLLIFPDGTSNNTLLYGIENPNFISTTVTITPVNVHQEWMPERSQQVIPERSQQVIPERNNSNPTPLLDLPPAYDTVIGSNASKTDSKPQLDPGKDAPPKYSDAFQ